MYVKIDLGYRVAYLVDDQGVTQLAQSGTTKSSVDNVLARWGYERTRDGKWQTTDILNAIDAVYWLVEPVKVGDGSAH